MGPVSFKPVQCQRTNCSVVHIRLFKSVQSNIAQQPEPALISLLEQIDILIFGGLARLSL
jgi:hypothetical protein